MEDTKIEINITVTENNGINFKILKPDKPRGLEILGALELAKSMVLKEMEKEA